MSTIHLSKFAVHCRDNPQCSDKSEKHRTTYWHPSKNVEKTCVVQTFELPLALTELEKDNKKTGHWAWYAFPTGMAGGNDPNKVKIINKKEQIELLDLWNGKKNNIWKKVLEKIKVLVKSKGKDILPEIDHGRVYFFCQEWKEVAKSDKDYKWLNDVILELEKNYILVSGVKKYSKNKSKSKRSKKSKKGTVRAKSKKRNPKK